MQTVKLSLGCLLLACVAATLAQSRSPFATCVAYDGLTVTVDGKKEFFRTDGDDERIWGLARIIDALSRTIIWTKKDG